MRARGDLGFQQVLGHIEFAQQNGRHGPATGLDAAFAVNQQHRVPGARQVIGGGCP